MTGGELPVRSVGSAVIVTMPEEIDLLNVAAIQQQLTAVLADRPGAVVVDMSATRYCDSAGIATLVRTSKAAAADQIQVRVAASRQVLRIMGLLGADQVIETHPSLAAAIGEPGGPPPAHRPAGPGRQGGPARPAGEAPPVGGSPHVGV